MYWTRHWFPLCFWHSPFSLSLPHILFRQSTFFSWNRARILYQNEGKARFSAKRLAGIPVCEFFSLPMVERERSGGGRGPLQSCVFTIHNVTGCCDDKTQSNDGIAIFYCRRRQPNYDQFNCAESISFWPIRGRASKRRAACNISKSPLDQQPPIDERIRLRVW